MIFGTPTSNTGTSATPSVAVPTGAAPGHIALLVPTIDAGAATFSGFWPAGFAPLGPGETGIGPDGQRLGIGWKRLTAAETGSWTFGDLGTSAEWQAHALLLAVRHAVNPPVASSAFNVVGTSQDSPIAVQGDSVAGLKGDDLIFVGALDLSGTAAGAAWAQPAGFTELIDLMTPNVSIGIAILQNLAAAGATGNKTATATLSAGTAGSAGILIRVPAATIGAVAANANG